MTTVNYTAAPQEVAEAIDASRPIVDFLPPPDVLIANSTRQKITINIDAIALTRFKQYAQNHGVKYQVLMNQVLSSYAKERLAL
ncbi:MAG: BrnA antitoxin family protein [Defluviitaleaceae bacterium]|nr:BrnA antitoxin family protein [Defluviitaleaceae bacterium]